MKKKFFTPGAVLAIVVIVAVAILGFIVWSLQGGSPATNSSSSSTSSTGTPSTSKNPGSGENPTSTAWQTYSSSKVHISFSFPPDWALGPNSPISLDNFNHQYLNDSIIPAGGAEIDITNTNLAGASLANIIATETAGDVVNATKSISVDGISCTEVLYAGSYGPGHPSNNSAVYCPDSANGLLYKIYLSYPAGDSTGARSQAVFVQVLNSVQFQ